MPKALLAILALIYPLLVYYGLLHFSVQWVGIALAVFLAARVLVLRKKLGDEQLKQSLFPALLLAILCALASVFLNQAGALKLIPTVINVAFLMGFATTLWKPPSMIERFARLQEPQLSKPAIRYTRQVTLVWCVFFIINGSIALYTALYSSMETWALYNGLIAYLLMGALFAIEYLVRLRVKKYEQQNQSL
ncbi:MAG: hypothetical protein R3E63_03225 [Pseudomonadales bacterium]